ncbi:MAG: hypothetical protein ACRERE_22565 [Candidatus Entotheonellia bacterium]
MPKVGNNYGYSATAGVTPNAGQHISVRRMCLRPGLHISKGRDWPTKREYRVLSAQGHRFWRPDAGITAALLPLTSRK